MRATRAIADAPPEVLSLRGFKGLRPLKIPAEGGAMAGLEILSEGGTMPSLAILAEGAQWRTVEALESC